LIGENAEGVYRIDILSIDNYNMPEDCGDSYYCAEGGGPITYNIVFSNFNYLSDLSFGMGCNENCDSFGMEVDSGLPLIVNAQNQTINISHSTAGGIANQGGTGGDFSITMTFYVLGRFDNSDVGIEGDMNDDGYVNIVDVVRLVNLILDFGTGDIDELIQTVKG
jgi:hypothetical protein